MNYTRKNSSDTQVVLTLTVDAADLATVKPITIAHMAKKVKIAGFRPGKVPAKIAEKHLDVNNLNMQIAEDVVNKFIGETLATENLQPLDRPQVELGKYVPGELLECTATFEILPNIKLGDYKKIKSTQTSIKITAKDIGDVVERMRLGMAEKKEVSRASRKADEVLIDFAGHDKDGKEVAGAQGKDYPLVLGSDSFIPGFEDGLIGKKAGDTLELPLVFPKDYHHQPLAGATVTFSVTVKNVKEIILPEVNDEFAAKCGPFKTVADLKADITRELTDQKEREALDKLKDHLVEQLVKNSHVPAPDVLITDQVTSLERDFTQNLMYRGMTLPQYLDQQKLTREEWFKKQLRPQAIQRVQIGLVLAELSKAEHIEVSMAELDQRLAEMMQQYGRDAKIRDQLDTPEVRRDIANRLVTEKTIERLVELNIQK